MPCIISVPTVEFGKVAGMLTVKRALIEDSTYSGDSISCRALIPTTELASFRTWLSKEVDTAKFEVAT